MRQQSLRRLGHAAAIGAWLLGAGCHDGAADSVGHAYLTDRDARRAALEASLPVDNEYARRRRAHYATGGGDDWELLPVWNPRVEAVSAAEASQPAAIEGLSLFRGAPEMTVVSEGSRTGDREELRRLGEAAFFRYPAQLLPQTLRLEGADVDRLGLWRDERWGAGGLTRAEMADGSARLAMTCATCHAMAGASGASGASGLTAGLGNARLNLGALLVEAAGRGEPLAVLDDHQRALLAWGPGRADVSTATGTLPVRLPDLRAARWLTHLQYSGAVRQNDLVSLAIRLETLLITSHGAALRPPREIALGLAIYLWSLGDGLPPPPASPGRDVLVTTCGGCHAGDGFSGAPVDASVVGTDPAAAQDPERGTGRYRIPSLRGVAARGALMHDASIGNLEALLDPGRQSPSGPTAHPFGLDLDVTGRAALLTFLGTL